MVASMPAGVWALDERVDRGPDLGRLLRRDQPERQLDVGVARHDRLAAGAHVAAPDAVDLGRRPGADALQRAEAALAGQRPRLATSRNSASSKGTWANRARSVGVSSSTSS